MKRSVVVPRGMVEAYLKGTQQDASTFAGLEAALLWLTENPIVPTDKQTLACWIEALKSPRPRNAVQVSIKLWLGRMFLALEPINPHIENLLWGEFELDRGVPVETQGIFVIDTHNAQIEEAFKRGQESVTGQLNGTPARTPSSSSSSST